MQIEFKMPELGENITAGTVARVLVAVGDSIGSGQNVLEVETDKAVAEIPCPFSGTITSIHVKEGAKVKAGDLLFLIEGASEARQTKQAVEQPPTPSVPKPTAPPKVSSSTSVSANTLAPQPATAGKMRAAPSIRKLALEHDVDLALVPSGDGSGRVSAQDVMAYIASQNAIPEPAPSADRIPPERSDKETFLDKWGEVETVPMNALRSKAAEHLSACWQTIPHVTHFDKADITGLEAFRKGAAKKADAQGVRLTVTAFLIKLLPEALKRFPRFNASVDMKEHAILLRKYYHVGVAVDTENGLLVPVLRSVDSKNVMEISREMSELAQKARTRKLSLEEMQGGTFTVSNLGGLGGHAFTPIINAPEVAILGVSRSSMEPVFVDGEFKPRLMLPLSLSYDHRIIDGADAARFLRFLCESLEQPWRLMLGD